MERRLFLFTGVSFLTSYSSGALAQDCSDGTIAELKAICRDSLRAAASTASTADSYFDAAIAQYFEASEPVFKCVQGGYDILQAAFKDCNPLSPVPNPVACVNTILAIPGIIEDCKTAVRLLQKAITTTREAIALYGAAGVEFGDTGGDEAAQKLFDCGDPTCREMGQAIYGYANDGRARATRNLEKLTELEENLKSVHGNLERCLADTEQCEEVPLFSIPDLETRDAVPPPINLP